MEINNQLKRIRVERLETERLILRKYCLDDADDYAEYRSNEHIYDFQPSAIKENKEQYTAELERLIKGYRKIKRPRRTWAVELKNEHKVIGSIGVEHYSVELKLCELSWQISVDYQRKGYATEAVERIIDLLFEKYQMNRVQVYIWQGNEASKNLALKLGFVHEGTERMARIKNGMYLDRLAFGLLRSEWKERKNSLKVEVK